MQYSFSYVFLKKGKGRLTIATANYSYHMHKCISEMWSAIRKLYLNYIQITTFML